MPAKYWISPGHIYSLFHHPDLLPSPSKCKVDPDVARRKSPGPLSDQLNGGRKSPLPQTNQSSLHRKTLYKSADESSGPGSSVDTSSSGESWRWVFVVGTSSAKLSGDFKSIYRDPVPQGRVPAGVWAVSAPDQTPGAEPAGDRSERGVLHPDTHDEGPDRAGGDQSHREPGPL